VSRLELAGLAALYRQVPGEPTCARCTGCRRSYSPLAVTCGIGWCPRCLQVANDARIGCHRCAGNSILCQLRQISALERALRQVPTACLQFVPNRFQARQPRAFHLDVAALVALVTAPRRSRRRTKPQARRVA
jgi:hypothetical protein